MSSHLIQPLTLTTSLVCLFGLGNLAYAPSASAVAINFSNWQTFGDAITQPNQAILTNAWSDGSNDIDNLGNPVNFNRTGTNPVFAFDLEFELGLSDGDLGFNSGESSALKRNLTVNAGEVLQFQWNFLTNHVVANPSRNDYGFVSINSQIFPLANTGSLLTSPGKLGFFKQTGFKTFSYTFPTNGNYTVGIGVVDAGDDITSSALVTTPVPEPLTLLGTSTALGMGVFFKKRFPKNRLKNKSTNQ